jgi:hypothetical protein
MDYLPELFQIREENVKSKELVFIENLSFYCLQKTFPLRFQILVKTFLGLFMTFR